LQDLDCSKKSGDFEGNGEFSLAGRDKYTPRVSWETGLVQLANEGKLSRLAARCQSGVAVRDFAQFRAGWFCGSTKH
jgi:hypothetical protein